MPFSAMLDANVLVPTALRDTLLRIAEAELYRPLWSDEILAETRRAVLRLRPEISAKRIDYLLDCMNEAFDDALVTGYEHLVESMPNHEGDRHVLAAAIVGRADVVVTANLRHFPTRVLAPLGMEALKPDQFLCLQYDLSPVLVVDAVRRQSAETGRVAGKPKLGIDELLASLGKCGAANFADQVQAHLARSKAR